MINEMDKQELVVEALCYIEKETYYRSTKYPETVLMVAYLVRDSNLDFDYLNVYDYIGKGEYKDCPDKESVFERVIQKCCRILMYNDEFMSMFFSSFSSNEKAIRILKDCIREENKSIDKSLLYKNFSIIYDFISNDERYSEQTKIDAKQVLSMLEHDIKQHN